MRAVSFAQQQKEQHSTEREQHEESDFEKQQRVAFDERGVLPIERSHGLGMFQIVFHLGIILVTRLRVGGDGAE